MEKQLLTDIVMMLVRRTILALGVAGVVTGDQAQQIGGAVVSLISVLWSVALHIKRGKINDDSGN
jgi:hypothetical protein